MHTCACLDVFCISSRVCNDEHVYVRRASGPACLRARMCMSVCDNDLVCLHVSAEIFLLSVISRSFLCDGPGLCGQDLIRWWQCPSIPRLESLEFRVWKQTCPVNLLSRLQSRAYCACLHVHWSRPCIPTLDETFRLHPSSGMLQLRLASTLLRSYREICKRCWVPF